jgi:uncharacterized membrane protein YhaH (DUF805 family)
MQPMQTNPQMMHLVSELLTFYLFFFGIFLVAIIVPTWFICKKAGFSPWLSFILIIPFGGLVLLYFLAFAEWKVVPAQQAHYQQPPLPPAPLPPAQG